MNRLTYREYNITDIDCKSCARRGDCYDSSDCRYELAKRLAVYEDAWESGTLHVFPFKVGDTVRTKWRPNEIEKVVEIGIDSDGMFVKTNLNTYCDEHFADMCVVEEQ